MQMQAFSITSQSKGKRLTNQDHLNIERWHNKEGLSNRGLRRLLNKAQGRIAGKWKRGEIRPSRRVKSFPKRPQENKKG